MARTGENIYKRKDGRWEARYIASYDGIAIVLQLGIVFAPFI